VEICSAFRIPNSTPFFTAEVRILAITLVFIPNCVTDTATISLRFIAESTVITETISAILPADGAHAIEAGSTLRIAKGSIFFLSLSAISYDFAYSTAIGILPAIGTINLDKSVSQK
jgi:hypothetical protein